ncbi:MAG: MarR family transcriptional regulator [Acidobacteriaceae bacterium]|nr:MarR family transcriptional regulator [Acidobacteriaceae bacterium]MBV8571334.1 MarR family transcriptional regulator [Acidobacteriaceae bacterium]
MSKPFTLIEEEATLSVLRTADVLEQHALEVLKPLDLTGPQYNVLRILRGSPDGLACGQIAERMISRDPDITRLLDRMEMRGLIDRERCRTDRRVITVRIKPAGLKLLAQVDPLITDSHRRTIGSLGERKMKQLIELLTEVREVITARRSTTTSERK